MMDTQVPSSWFPRDAQLSPPPSRPDPFERWVGVSAMAVLMFAGVAAVLL